LLKRSEECLKSNLGISSDGIANLPVQLTADPHLKKQRAKFLIIILHDYN